LGDKDSVVLEYVSTRRPELREEIVVKYQNLVDFIARKFSYNKSDTDDLYQVGMIGLLRSLDRFDPSMDVDFSTFATPNIIGEIKHYFRDKNRLVKAPRKLQELSSKVRSMVQQAAYNGQSLTVPQIAEAMGETEERILEAMECSQNATVISLDTPSIKGDFSSGMENNSPTLLDTIGVDGNEDVLLNKETLREVISNLPERNQEIIYLRFYCGFSQLEIATRVGLSQMHVSRILTKSLEELRSLLSRD
jgi:RNA polymerase sigma-B factor